MLDPVSPQALAISNIFNITFAISVAIFALVTGVVVYAAFRYRSRPDAQPPRQVQGHTALEIAWTAGPTLIMAFLFGTTVVGYGLAAPGYAPAYRTADVTAGRQQPPQADIVVVAHQWWWEVVYPQQAITTANEIHLPVGRPMRVRLESDDVIHDLWIPRLSRKMDATPGHITYLTLQADQPGTYYGACAEYCGTEHAWMLIRAIAHPPAEFDAWVREQSRPAPPLPTPPPGTPTAVAAVTTPLVPTALSRGDPVRGAILFQQKTCINCHTINGTTAQGLAGPNLTHFASRQTIGAGVLDMSHENIVRWIANPQAVKPGVHMPNMLLTEQEVNDLAAFMESLK
jgi:cytochrome c oxidase subunit 2